MNPRDEKQDALVIGQFYQGLRKQGIEHMDAYALTEMYVLYRWGPSDFQRQTIVNARRCG